MNPNLTDPTGVQALLDQIRSSSAWQQLSASHPPSASEPTEHPPQLAKPEPPNSSVATLLSQLQSPPHSQSSKPTSSFPQRDAPSLSEKDLRFVDLDDAMPILLRLSREPSFIDEIKKIKQDQDALERQLWEERRNIHRKYEDKLKAAQTKANIIGVNVSKHESDMIVDAHKKEIRKFDTNRALSAWDSLVSQQQLKLQKLKVPTMHITTESPARELQQRVLQVLISIIGPSIK
ncbi:hypothetical protein Agabi119p4_4515 [Agaricus bisporus var. burnettii]|uniref:Uncharacterized protein n=1 Tax=Agaricus bisporus var. burnettii TaxID=192524 RepID=A0A8H7F3F2_AGABI|nr:hypothetical protein Agabi119p4_4515 [Agaricus bisporus var. burnettii]